MGGDAWDDLTPGLVVDLLTRCPRLHHLRLEGSSVFPYAFVQHLRRIDAVDRPPSLARLRFLHIARLPFKGSVISRIAVLCPRLVLSCEIFATGWVWMEAGVHRFDMATLMFDRQAALPQNRAIFAAPLEARVWLLHFPNRSAGFAKKWRQYWWQSHAMTEEEGELLDNFASDGERWLGSWMLRWLSLRTEIVSMSHSENWFTPDRLEAVVDVVYAHLVRVEREGEWKRGHSLRLSTRRRDGPADIEKWLH